MNKQLTSFCLVLLAFTCNSQTTWGTSLNSGSSAPKFGLSTDHSLGFYTNNSLRMTLTNAGRFGIGTASPHAEFEVVGKGIFSGDLSTSSAILMKDNFRLDYVAGTTGMATNVISFRSGTGTGIGTVSPYDFKSLCQVNFGYEPNYPGPMNYNRVAFGPTTANLLSDLVQITDAGQNAALSLAVMNGDGIIALEPLNGYAGVGPGRALKLNPGCPVDVNICEGGGLTKIFNGAEVHGGQGLFVYDYGIKDYATSDGDQTFTIYSREPSPNAPPAETFRIFGTGSTEVLCRGANMSLGTVFNINEVSGNQNMNLLNLSSGSTPVNLFTVKANGQTTIKANSTAGLALNIKNNMSDVFSFYGNGYTEIKVNNPSAMPSDRVLAIKDMMNTRDLFVVKKDGKVYAREVEISNVASFPDYVFNKSYNLKTIPEVENFIKENNHLPGFEKGRYYEENGINVSDLLVKQQEKLEEQMLYIIQLEKRLQALEKRK